MTSVITRLALIEFRARRLQTVLTLTIVTLAAATLALALQLRATANDPWQKTFDATHGAHVWVIAERLGVTLSSVAGTPGIVESTSVVYVNTSFVRSNVRYGLALAARGRSRGGVDQPAVTSGTWLRPGSVVVERSFAQRLGIGVGDSLRIASTSGSIRVPVVGIAVTSGRQGYPRQQPGLAWTTRQTLARVQPDRRRLLHALGVRLAAPDAVGAFLASAARRLTAGAHIVDWRSLRAEAAADTRDNQKVLSTQAIFLLLAAGFILATLVAARVLAQSREIGLLKAIGITPRQVAAVYLFQYLSLGLVGVAIGLGIARLLAPALVRTSGAVLGATSTAGPGISQAMVVLAVVESIVGTFVLVPSWRSARRTTAAVLAEGPGSSSAARSRLARLAEAIGLAPSAAIGLKESFARPARAVLTAFSLALTVAVCVAVLDLESSWRDRARADARPASAQIAAPPALPTVGPHFGGDPGYDSVRADRARLRPLVYGSMGILGLIGLSNLLATAILGVRERRREFGILRAIGMTPRQIGVSVVWTYGALGLLAAIIGVPLGLLTYRIVGDASVAPWWWLLLVGPATVVACTVAALGPARQAVTGITVSTALRAE